MVVADLGREFLKEFMELLEAELGRKGVGGAGVPESHGKVERTFRTLRWAVEREQAQKNAPRNEQE